jgi:hypothetical protein
MKNDYNMGLEYVGKNSYVDGMAMNLEGNLTNIRDLNDNFSLGPELIARGSGFFLVFFNVNAETEVPHIECDMSYTLIHVLKQTHNREKAHLLFQFVFNHHQTLHLSMTSNVSFVYQAFLLTHRQRLLCPSKSTYNIASYCPQRFLIT